MENGLGHGKRVDGDDGADEEAGEEGRHENGGDGGGARQKDAERHVTLSEEAGVARELGSGDARGQHEAGEERRRNSERHRREDPKSRFQHVLGREPHHQRHRPANV